MIRTNEQIIVESESKIRKVLFNEVSFFISIIGVVIGCVLFVSKPDSEMRMDIAMIQLRIQEIETNHLKGIEADMDEMKDDIIEINLTLMKILTLLEENDT